MFKYDEKTFEVIWLSARCPLWQRSAIARQHQGRLGASGSDWRIRPTCLSDSSLSIRRVPSAAVDASTASVGRRRLSESLANDVDRSPASVSAADAAAANHRHWPMRQRQQSRVRYNSAAVDIADIGAQVNDSYHAARNRQIYASTPPPDRRRRH